MKDKNDKPIFEGDELLLITKDIDFGGSYIGNLCKFYSVDSIKIKVLENDDILQIKHCMTFYKDNIQIITNQENAYWVYCDNCREDGIEVEKTLEDFDNVKDASDLLDNITSNSFFFSYIVGKGVEKVSGFDGEAIVESDENLRIETKFEESVFIGDSVLVKLDDDFKQRLGIDPEDKELSVNEYTHLKFQFTRINERFNFKTKVTLTDENGICKVFDIVLNEEGEKQKQEFNSEINKIDRLSRNQENTEAKEEIKKIQSKKASLYDDEKNTKHEDYIVFFGFNNEIKVINMSVKKNFEIKKLNA